MCMNSLLRVTQQTQNRSRWNPDPTYKYNLCLFDVYFYLCLNLSKYPSAWLSMSAPVRLCLFASVRVHVCTSDCNEKTNAALLSIVQCVSWAIKRLCSSNSRHNSRQWTAARYFISGHQTIKIKAHPSKYTLTLIGSWSSFACRMSSWKFWRWPSLSNDTGPVSPAKLTC